MGVHALSTAAEILWSRRVSGAEYFKALDMVGEAPPAVRAELVARYARTAGPVRLAWSDGKRVHDSFNAAMVELRATHHRLRAARVPVAFDEEEILARAERIAQRCREIRNLDAALEVVAAQGIEAPAGPRVTASGIRRRLNSPSWWRRRLRTKLRRSADEVFRELGMVHRHASAFVSADGLARHRQQRRQNAEFLGGHDVLCQDTGELFPLDAIAAKSVSHPAIRRGELMVRARGFQEIAEARGDRGIFLTLTCPSAFHARLEKSGDANPRWNGATPREGRAWLNRIWARVRAKLKRLSISYYGFRVAEPNHDGTPHWHAVLYCAPHHVDAFLAVVRAGWLSEYGDEPGASEVRTRCKVEDPAIGSGVGYIAKYIAKNIDGHGAIGAAESDEGAGAVSRDCEAAIAWSRVHGIRQFQQLGGPVVTLWRELRRLREPQESPDIEALRAPTDKTEAGGPSWSRFIAALGGIENARERSRAALDREFPKATDPAGREVLRVNTWGELPGEGVVGVRALSCTEERVGADVIRIERWSRARTRLYRWRQVRRMNATEGAVPVVKARELVAATGETGADRLAAPDSRLFLPLGPVAISIRPDVGAPPVDYSWVATVPYRESARAGPS